MYPTLPSPGASVIEGSFLGDIKLLRLGIERDRLADPHRVSLCNIHSFFTCITNHLSSHNQPDIVVYIVQLVSKSVIV